MATLSAYLTTWRLKHSDAKTLTEAYYLLNRETKCKLMHANGKLLPFYLVPTYFWVKLDRSLKFRQIAGNKALRTSALSLVNSTAQYYEPLWCRRGHTCFIDRVLNDALHIVLGCLRSAPTDHLPMLSGVEPAARRHFVGYTFADEAWYPGTGPFFTRDVH